VPLAIMRNAGMRNAAFDHPLRRSRMGDQPQQHRIGVTSALSSRGKCEPYIVPAPDKSRRDGDLPVLIRP
jgi:hypothetical protein